MQHLLLLARCREFSSFRKTYEKLSWYYRLLEKRAHSKHFQERCRLEHTTNYSGTKCTFQFSSKCQWGDSVVCFVPLRSQVFKRAKVVVLLNSISRFCLFLIYLVLFLHCFCLVCAYWHVALVGIALWKGESKRFCRSRHFKTLVHLVISCW